MIDHTLLEIYEKAQGDLDRVPADQRKALMADWTALEEILLDLHMIRYGYTTEGYARHVERRLSALCGDESVVERVKASRA
jgi:hypothetical protein